MKNHNAIKVVGHRGLRSYAPENTLHSIRKALSANLHGIEFDVELTQDAIPIIVHQETLMPDGDSTTQLVHADRNAENRWVNDSPWSQLKELDAGSWFDAEFAEERIPLFSDVLSLDWKHTTAFIELKDSYFWSARNKKYEERLLGACMPLLHEATLPFALLSFNEHLLKGAQNLGFTGPLVFNIWHDRAEQMSEVLGIAEQLDVAVVDLAEDILLKDPSWCKAVHECGRELYVYEVSPAHNEPNFHRWTPENRHNAWAQLVEIGVDGIITDFPLELTDFLNSEAGT